MKRFMTRVTATIGCLLAMATTASADEYDHIDRMAIRIQNKTKQLLRETIHFRHTANYALLVQETNSLNQLATHIHDVTHFEGNLVHLRSDLQQLDSAFHRLEDLFDIIEHNTIHGTGHVHGNIKHVKRLMNSIEDAIHHIQSDVVQLQRHTSHRPHYNPVPTYTRPVIIPSQPVYRPDPGCNGFAPAPAAIVPASRHQTGYRGHGYGSFQGHGSGHGNRNANRGQSGRGNGIGFTIGGGSSQIHFRF